MFWKYFKYNDRIEFFLIISFNFGIERKNLKVGMIKIGGKENI